MLKLSVQTLLEVEENCKFVNQMLHYCYEFILSFCFVFLQLTQTNNEIETIEEAIRMFTTLSAS